MSAFLIDQAQEQVCQVFAEVRARYRTKKGLWERMRAMEQTFRLPDWEAMMALLIDPDAVRVDIDPRPG